MVGIVIGVTVAWTTIYAKRKLVKLVKQSKGEVTGSSDMDRGSHGLHVANTLFEDADTRDGRNGITESMLYGPEKHLVQTSKVRSPTSDN